MSKSLKNKEKQFDVAIVGGGLSGLTMACLLTLDKNLRVACIDQDTPEALKVRDERTTAISYGSSKVLERAGVWPRLVDRGCPIEDIKILDGNSPLLLEFLSSEAGGRAFGWIFENADIRTALNDTLKTRKNFTHIAPRKVTNFEEAGHAIKLLLNSAEKLEAALVIGADGRFSSCREWMDVPLRRVAYGQRAVICRIRHENPHHNMAVEHFRGEGPFAILPLNDDAKGRHYSSLVFTEHGPQSKSRMNMSDQAFALAVAEKFPDCYGAVELAGPRGCYPLSLQYATRYIAPRIALVADAAHGIHPIAGQGLNLGFRDLDCLAGLVLDAAARGQDIAAPELLQSYQRKRRPDNLAMIFATDSLVRLFSNDLAPVRLARRIGLRAVSRLTPAKRFFMRHAMGDHLSR